MGLANWEGKQDWLLDYVKTVAEIKMFGIIIVNSYRTLVKRNWEERFKNFENNIRDWSSRCGQDVCIIKDILCGISVANEPNCY